MLEEKILNVKFYNKHKKVIRIVYKQQSLQERYRIKRALYRSDLSSIKKDEIWRFLNAVDEDNIWK